MSTRALAAAPERTHEATIASHGALARTMPSPRPITLTAPAAMAHLGMALRAGQARLRQLLGQRMAMTAGAVCVAGALHGALGTPWMSLAMAAGAAVLSLHAHDEDRRADARAVADSLGAVGLYSLVRDACCGALAIEPAQKPASAAAAHQAWTPAVPFNWPRSAAPTVTATECADRELTAEHQEALLAYRRGENPSAIRRRGRDLLALLEQKARAAEPGEAAPEIQRRLQQALERAATDLRRARLSEEATERASWNASSPAARRHTLRCVGGAFMCPAWSEDEARLAEVTALIEAITTEPRARGQPQARAGEDDAIDMPASG